MLNLHATALRERGRLFAGELQWLDSRPDVVALRRGNVTSVTVFGAEPFTPPAEWGEVALSSAPETADRLLPGESTTWLVA